MRNAECGMQDAALVINLKHGLSLLRWGQYRKGGWAGCSSGLCNQRRDQTRAPRLARERPLAA